MDIENLHIIDNHTIFYEGNKHYIHTIEENYDYRHIRKMDRGKIL